MVDVDGCRLLHRIAVAAFGGGVCRVHITATTRTTTATATVAATVVATGFIAALRIAAVAVRLGREFTFLGLIVGWLCHFSSRFFGAISIGITCSSNKKKDIKSKLYER